MPSRPRASPGTFLRRAVGAVVLVATGGIFLVVITRVAPRSPIVILVACVLGVLIMKLVERRLKRWRQRWDEQEAARNRPAGPGR
jgi:fructose-specific phosphotransferase system IIC component